jgi:Ca-activated chloride channel homolog
MAFSSSVAVAPPGGLVIMALVFYRPAFYGLLVLLALVLLVIARRYRLRWWPAYPMRLLIIALIMASLFFPRGELQAEPLQSRQVLIIDQMINLPADIQTALFEQATTWRNGEGNRLLISFGTNWESVSIGQEHSGFDAQVEDLSAALDLAVEFLGASSGNIFLASAGMANSNPMANAALDRLTYSGHSLDIISFWELDPNLIEMVSNDVALVSLTVPPLLWEGASFDINTTIYSPQDREATLRWSAGGEILAEEIHSLTVGIQQFSLLVQAPSSELYSLEVNVIAEGDPRPQNNVQFATVKIYPSPRVLILSSLPNDVQNLVESLQSERIEVKVLSPEQMPTNLEELNYYRVIFLHNFLANQLSQEQMAALKIFVTKHGGGVVFLGGRNSFTLGGYKNTLLEPLMPVKLEPPPRPNPATLVLVIDKSSSMKTIGALIQPMDLAKEAAMRVIETLGADDMLGLITYDRGYEWELPVSAMGDGLTLRQALDIVSQIRSGGGTKTYNALQGAIEGLRSSGLARDSFIILLSDGKSADGKWETFQDLASEAHADGITISTVALGPSVDQETMRRIAEAGKGRYYQVLDPTDLPRIMLSESKAARNENIQDGLTSLSVSEHNHPVLSGLNMADLPILNAYNALTSKADLGAEDVLLSSNFNDPVFSVWQVGLGRVAAWMGDLGEEWTTSWSDSKAPGLHTFWSQVVRYSLPDPSLGPAAVNVSTDNSSITVQASILDEFGVPVNFAKPQFAFSNQDGAVELSALPQTGPGIYEIQMPRAREGVYQSVLNYISKEKEIFIEDSFAINYPEEYALLDQTEGQANLTRWAELGDGQMVSLKEELAAPSETDIRLAARAEDWKWVLLAILLIWPVEIAVRRRWLPWVT